MELGDNLLEAALELADQGVAVFPVGLDKKPRNNNGFHGATTDPEQINKWNWVGGAIGTAIPEGHFVIDIDPRNGGDQTIKALLGVGRALTATKVVETQSGGTHRYYKIPKGTDVAKLRSTLGPGVDIKASGKGYVLAPPSPGYKIKWDSPIVEAPEWVMDEIAVSHADAAPGEASEAKFFPFENGTAYGLTAFQMEIDELANVGEGGRNNALNKSAFSLAQLVAGGELSEKYALTALEDTSEAIGLSRDEYRQTIKSGWTAGFSEPRQAPAAIEPEPDQEISELDVELDEDDFAEDGFWTDFVGMEDMGPPKYYLFPIIPRNAYLLVYGPTEASKSMVFLALAAEGSHKGVKTDIYSLENPPHIDVDRIRRWKPNPENLRVSHQLLDLADPRQVSDLIRRSVAHGTDLIMLDTYSHAFNSRSEDGNAKAIQFAKIIRHILKEVDCTVIVVDHTGYSAHGEPRDASAKRQAVDMSIKMERAVEWKPNQPAVFRMDNTKSARFGNPFEMIGRIVDVPGDTRDLDLKWDRQFAAPTWKNHE